MLIAKQKRNENIIEYILYMWQLEDFIRACNFNFEHVVAQRNLTDHAHYEERQWFQAFLSAMKHEGIEQSGHLMQLKELVQDLSAFNIALLQNPEEVQYKEAFNAAMPHIATIIEKSNNTLKNEIDACITAVYGLLLLRLKKQKISEESEEAFKTITHLLAFLAFKYKKYESGELHIN
ncbi:MAG: DUF4924 family protein [Bacteroidales bacterium]|jgi:hypothetical protein|nr:DUF4924 family protein [Bacteroidales bacterium]